MRRSLNAYANRRFAHKQPVYIKFRLEITTQKVSFIFNSPPAHHTRRNKFLKTDKQNFGAKPEVLFFLSYSQYYLSLRASLRVRQPKTAHLTLAGI